MSGLWLAFVIGLCIAAMLFVLQQTGVFGDDPVDPSGFE